MRTFCIVLIAACCLPVFVSRAQDTNAPKTEIEVFEAQTNAVIVKGFSQTGSMSVGTAVISVRCKESVNVNTGRKVYGLAVDFTEGNQPRERLFVDYDEIDSLLNGINYLVKITYDVTPLPGFEACYSTKSGLRVVAYSSRRQGGIQTFLQYSDHPRMALTSDQMTQFHGLIGQAKDTLDSIRNAK